MARTLASSIIARAISTIWRWATFKVRMGAAGSMVGSSGARASAAARSCMRRATNNPAGGLQRAAQEHVLRNGEFRNVLQFLMDHGDAGPPGRQRAVPDDLDAVDFHVARGGLDHAGQDVQQRRLAGAVFAEQARARCRADGHVDALERSHRPEALADVDQPQSIDWCHSWNHLLPGA